MLSRDIDAYFDYFKDNGYVRYCEAIILGFLSYRNLSGYDIDKLINGNKTIFSGLCRINKASIYNTVSRLEEDESIHLVEIITEEKKPPKHIYNITEKGKERLSEVILGDLGNAPLLFSNVFFDVVFMKNMDQAEVKPLLEAKIKQLKHMDLVVSALDKGVANISSLVRKYESRFIRLNVEMLEEYLDWVSGDGFYIFDVLTEDEIRETLNHKQ